jgi:hypothetical protein
MLSQREIDSAENVAKREARRVRARRQSAAERLMTYKGRPGQLTEDEIPMMMQHYGECFSPFTIQNYIVWGIGYRPIDEGMNVFIFTAEGGRRVYAATVPDAVDRGAYEVCSWHVELYSKPSFAWAEIERVERQVARVLN